MKKFLLSFAAALVAMSVSAAHPVKKELNVAKIQKGIILKKGINEHMKVATIPVAEAATKATTAKAVKMQRRAAGNEIFGAFVQTFAGEEVEGFVGTAIDTLYKANKVIAVPVDEAGNTEDMECNIMADKVFANWYCSEYYGSVYEEEGNTYMQFPASQLFNHIEGVDEESNPYNYDLYLYGIILSEDGTKIENVSDVYFVDEGDGIFTCPLDGIGVYYMDHETEKGLGWGGFLWETSLLPANSCTSLWFNSRNTAGQTVRYDYENPSFVEDWGTDITLYGWCGTKLDIQIEDDLTVKIATGTPIFDEDLTEKGGYLWDAGPIVLRGVEFEENGDGTYTIHINTNGTEEYVYGVLKGDSILIPYIGSSSQNDGKAGGKPEYEGYYYGLTLYRDNKIVLNEGNHFAVGIKEVAATREEQIKNTKTFNLMGQAVNRKDVKGLLIRNGKKYISK